MIARTIVVLLLSLLLTPPILRGQNPALQRLDPPFWWAGMQEQDLQLLVYGQDMARYQAQIDYPGVTLLSREQVANPNYLFLNLRMGPGVKPGLLPILFQRGQEAFTVQYELKAREGFDNRIQGVTSEDFIYLLMPDRFANGDPNNDNIANTQQPVASRTTQYGRHGGDLQGIYNHLDYFAELGVTALWLNPVLINDQPHESYHGYAATDHYRIDPRLGSNENYVELVRAGHAKGIKMIGDIIHNHVGDQHWFIQDLPDPSWIHQWPEFTKSNFRAPVLMDPYASKQDRKIMTDGWFDTHMPDLNQQNPLLAKYLIQNNIWWVEYAGLDGFRVDTYAYPDQAFMADWAEAVRKEYPQLTIFAETWVHGIPIQAWFQEKNGWKPDSYLPATTDFQLYYALNDALTQNFGWTEGMARIYYTLAQDFVYPDPMANVVFLDNHDVGRFYSYVKEDFRKYQMGMAFLLTTRGTPQLYYGTEILMKNDFDWGNHDKVREAFPGGWKGDKANKFLAEGRTPLEQQAFQYIKTLAQFRKGSSALKTGKLMQFIPEEGVYVYFRYDERQTVMVILSQNEEVQTLNLARFAERIGDKQQAMDIFSGKVMEKPETLTVQPWSATILNWE